MQAYENEHLRRLRALLPECAVLLRSNGDFPLAEPCDLALYGSGARRTVKGGTGSGEVNSRAFVNAEQGLTEAGFTVTTKAWLDGYESVYAAAKKRFAKALREKAKREHKNVMTAGMGAVMPEPDYALPLGGAGDAAVYVLARNSGEGNDRRPIPGDVLLTETEKRDILAVREKYAKFMLVLNVGGPVDLSPVRDVENILLLSQLGVDTGAVLGDLLLGRAYPSGKLAATWAAWQDYPDIGDFGEPEDTCYREGIYVGYRYFDSVGQKAMFPFGYGVGYTTFSVTEPRVSVEGAEVCVRATVTNTGAHAGREVAQLYVSVPAGRLDQPYQTLASFVKTGELAPGESQEAELRFVFTDLAAYDAQNAAYILEAGDYILRLGTSSADTAVCGVVRLDADAAVRRVRHIGGTPGFRDWRPQKPRELTAPESAPVLAVSAADIPASHAEYDNSPKIDPAVEALPDEKLALLNVGAFSAGGGVSGVIGSAGRTVAGAAGETTGELKADGFPPLVMADGPAGLRLSRDYFVDKKGAHSMGGALPESVAEVTPAPVRSLVGLMAPKPKRGTRILHQYATAIPIGAAVAQSWNIDLAERCGDIVGDEMERFGVHLWLAPALNIHRSILCGRNFEYFSEDPLLSGLLAAAITRGVQRHPGRGVTIKHFAANNQETNRYNSNSRVSERALREIYLRGFAICIRQAQPHAVMTSYNLINGRHSSERRDLIEDFLRGECGFEGIVMTDWLVALGMFSKGAKYPAPTAAGVAAAGGDVVMPGSRGDYRDILKGLRSGRLSREQLRINATRVARMVRKLNERRITDMDKTYSSWQDWARPSLQTEYTAPTPLLAEDGTLLAKGWARENVFRYDRDRVKHILRRKEWDFYQISDGRHMVQISFANISLGGYASAVLVDLQGGRTVASAMAPFLGGRDRYVLPPRGDKPGHVRFNVGGAVFETDTRSNCRTLRFRSGDVQGHFSMDILPGLENITTVLPFEGQPDRYFMTTKQNSMPCEGVFHTGREAVRFSKEDAFCVLDWGRVCTPYRLVWYWGNGSAWLTDENGEKHIFGFEITWGIGDESNATETCLFYDGKAHKIGAVDVEVFPKPDGYMRPWKFISEDGRFDLTMTPFYDHHSDMNILAMRMHSHQVHGLWNGRVTLDDGKVLEIRDMYAFCEYVENRW